MSTLPTLTPTSIEAYVDAAAAVLQLPLAPGHRPGVLRYFELAAGMAERVFALPLGLDDEPAESFVPISPVASSLVSSVTSAARLSDVSSNASSNAPFDVWSKASSGPAARSE